MLRIAVLASGSGSNLQALIDAAPAIGYKIVLVIGNVPGARAFERAELAGIPAALIPHKEFASREVFDAAIAARLRASGADLICLAGFMRILGAEFVSDWQGQIINIHPSLLPAFKGLNTHARALEAGVALHGCTVHHVTASLDDGPILVQGALGVRQDDDATTLAARVLRLEHRCYPQAIRLLIAQKQQCALPEMRRLLLDPSLAENR